MPSAAKVAEWILSLVTTQQRASATVGDCLEDTRGTVSFGWFILRTTASICARDAWHARSYLLWLWFYAVVIWNLLGAVFVIAPEMLRISIVVALGGTDDGLNTTGWWAKIVAIVIVPFLVGRTLGKRSGGREIAAALTFALLPGAILLILNTALPLLSHQTPKFHFPLSYGDLFLLAGALTWRARHPRPA